MFFFNIISYPYLKIRCVKMLEGTYLWYLTPLSSMNSHGKIPFCSLSAMGVIWPSDAQWVRHTRQGQEEVKLLPLPRHRTCFEQKKVVLNKQQNMILVDVFHLYSEAFNYQHNASHSPYRNILIELERTRNQYWALYELFCVS